MPTDEATLAELRQADESDNIAWRERLAGQIAPALPYPRDDALRVLRLAEAILNIEPPPSEEA